MLLDGFNGSSRNPYHLSALTRLRNNGRDLLTGYGSQPTILRDGLSEDHVPQAAELEAAVTFAGVAYVRSGVPDAMYSGWKRHILCLNDSCTLVADAITARSPGNLEL